MWVKGVQFSVCQSTMLYYRLERKQLVVFAVLPSADVPTEHCRGGGEMLCLGKSVFRSRRCWRMGAHAGDCKRP